MSKVWYEFLPQSQTVFKAFPRPEKSCAVVRPGAYGDTIWASSILPHLKAEGYHVTLYTEERGFQVLEHDPHIDRFFILQDGVVKMEQLGPFFAAEEPKYDRWVNLVETVEGNLLLPGHSLRAYWPHALRDRLCDINYMELIHDVAGVPREFKQKFYATEDETTWAKALRHAWRGLVVLAPNGSSCTKHWPHAPAFVDAVLNAYRDVMVCVVGDYEPAVFTPQPGLTVLGRGEPIRRVLALAQVADVVVGQETGVLNAVALEAMRKVVLLTHSSVENLTKHWVNTAALAGLAKCYPCHRLHTNWSMCDYNEKLKAAACQAGIPSQAVMQQVEEVFGARNLPAAA